MDDTDTAASAARIAGGPPRSEPVTLTWPVEFGGRIFSTIVVRRLSTAEVAAFGEALRSEDGKARLPMFAADDGEPIPDAVLDAMDHDDTAAVNEVAERLLPLALRGVLTSGSVSEIGDTSQE